MVYNAIGDALAFTITPGSGTYANRVVTLGNCDGVGGSTGGFPLMSLPFAMAPARPAPMARSIRPSSAENGDQLGTFNFHTRGYVLTQQRYRNRGRCRWRFHHRGRCDGQICVYKFRADGAPDTSPCVADVDADGRVSAASDGLAGVRNMLGVPIPVTIPPGLGYDIDGDGVLNASRDGLLILRRMLGFTGTALLRDIPSATTARPPMRPTSKAICARAVAFRALNIRLPLHWPRERPGTKSVA